MSAPPTLIATMLSPIVVRRRFTWLPSSVSSSTAVTYRGEMPIARYAYDSARISRTKIRTAKATSRKKNSARTPMGSIMARSSRHLAP